MAVPGVVDIRLIDPSEKQLAATLRKAHITANRAVTARNVKLERDLDFWGRFAHDCMREPAGRRRSCKAGHQTPEVIAGWWTDPAGRRHFRVIGRTRMRWGRLRGEGELRGLPPWWQVYPESVLAVRQLKDDTETYLACCRCGKVGTPDSLGWMGDTCGPCFDRRADGGVPATGFGHYTGWSGWQPRLAFTSDSLRIIGPNVSNKVRLINRETGDEQLRKQLPGAIAAAAATERGFVLGSHDGSVHTWDGTETGEKLLAKARQILAKPNQYGRFTLSPDGRWAIVASQTSGFTADLTATKPSYSRVDGLRTYTALRFGSNSKRLFGISPTGELISLEPETLTETVLRENVFDGVARYGFPHDLSIAPDESAAAVVRETYYPPSHTVRVIPLRSKAPFDVDPVYDLPIPGWHKPNVVAFAPDGKHLATADPQAGWVGFWKIPSCKSLGFVRAVPEDPSWRGGQILFSPDGRSIAVVYSGHHQERGSTVVIWPWPDVAQAAGG